MFANNQRGREEKVRRDIIVVGASAGGVEALSRLLGDLPRSIPASFFVVLHVSPFSESFLPKILERAGNLRAKHPEDGEQIKKHTIYVAPPDFHLGIERQKIRLGHGPKENRHRPSIDVLFRSAARSYGPRVAGILLTGNLDDGLSGLVEIQRSGGLAIVQDPQEAAYPEMPIRALGAMNVDHCMPLKDISRAIMKVVAEPNGARMAKPKRNAKLENQSPTVIAVPPKNGPPTALTCPECNGPLWEFKNGNLMRYECLVGHRYSMESLLAAHSEEVEQALWVALRTLEERIALQRRLSEDARSRNSGIAAANFAGRATKNAQHARLLRKILEELAPERSARVRKQKRNR